MGTLQPQHAFFNLEGHVAVVTGAGQGIGEAIARRLTAAGARVAALDLREELAEQVASSLGTVGIHCDVASASSVQFASREASFTTGQCYDISGGRATY